jgi:hypothetical protein
VTHSEKEREVIALRAVSELISSIVNFEVLSIFGKDPHSEARFPSATHQKYFNIVLVDFLSRIDENIAPPGGSYIDALKSICAAPQFESHRSIDHLRVAVTQLDSWLEERIYVETWMPSIDLQVDLSVTRSLVLRIGGNVSKHNFLRLGGTARELQRVLEESGTTVNIDQALLALSDVYDRFHRDILNYHSSTIAELLNNVRWGIHDYLLPEFHRSFTPDSEDRIQYRYVVPDDIQSGLAIDCYWGAMNDVRAGPFVRRFTATEWLKKRY